MAAAQALEISVQEVKRMIDADEDFLLLDVREPDEHRLARIDGSVLLPLGDVAGRVEELRAYTDRPMVIYCHHGVRSLHAATWLRSKGFDHAQSMAGGIDAWSRRIDPAVRRY